MFCFMIRYKSTVLILWAIDSGSMWMIHIIKWKTDRERKGERTKMITADRLSYVQI